MRKRTCSWRNLGHGRDEKWLEAVKRRDVHQTQLASQSWIFRMEKTSASTEEPELRNA